MSEKKNEHSSSSPSSSSFSVPVPRHKVPVAANKTLSHWMVYKETLKRKWPLENLDREQVSLHNTADDCWMIINGFIFNITPYLDFHPGGKDILLEYAGQDVTKPFRMFILAKANSEYHAWVNWENILDTCIVGRVID